MLDTDSELYIRVAKKAVLCKYQLGKSLLCVRAGGKALANYSRKFENNRCPLALENNLRIIGTAPRNSWQCIMTLPLLATYNLEWYHYSKRAIQMLRGQF